MCTMLKAAAVMAIAMISTVCSFPTQGSHNDQTATPLEGAGLYLGALPGTHTFMGPLTPGGPNVTISGTIHEIYDVIQTTNPEYVEKNVGHAKERVARDQGLAKRWREVYCKDNVANWNEEWPHKPSPMDDAVKHLEGLGANTVCFIDAWATVSFFCEGKNAVVLTNTVDHRVTPTCSELLDGVKRIFDKCQDTGFLRHIFNGRVKPDNGDYLIEVEGMDGRNACIQTPPPK